MAEDVQMTVVKTEIMDMDDTEEPTDLGIESRDILIESVTGSCPSIFWDHDYAVKTEAIEADTENCPAESQKEQHEISKSAPKLLKPLNTCIAAVTKSGLFKKLNSPLICFASNSEVMLKNFNTFVPPREFYLILGDQDADNREFEVVDTRLQCPICSECFPTKFFLLKHTINLHPSECCTFDDFSCAQCKKQFENLNNMDDHWMKNECSVETVEIRRQRAGCRFCSEFPNKGKESVLWHESTDHSEEFLQEKLQCCLCKHHFSTFEAYKKHMLQRDCLNLCFECHQCFPSTILLTDHINQKHADPDIHFSCISCAACGTQFRELLEKVGHVCPKYCSFCDVTFRSYSLFYNHMHEIHRTTGYHCKHCDGIFEDSKKFKAHCKSQRCRKCSLCQLVCKNKVQLLSHKCPIQPLTPVTYFIQAPVPKDVKPDRPAREGETHCQFCKTFFLDSAWYQNHLTPENCLGCRLCDFVAEHEQSLLRHVLVEHKQNLSVRAKEEEVTEQLPPSIIDLSVLEDGDISEGHFYCTLCDQFVSSAEQLKQNHRVWVECAECKVKVQCKVCFVKHVAIAHSSMCQKCSLFVDLEEMHSRKRHASGAGGQNEPFSLFMCSLCNENAFDKDVLMKNTKECKHLGSLWQFELKIIPWRDMKNRCCQRWRLVANI